MLKILHLESSKLIKAWLKNRVEYSGNTYYAANGLEEGMRLLQTEAIDIVITAMEFKDYAGLKFIESLNASEYKDTPIIVLTSTDNLEMREHIYNLGVIDYLVKGQVDDHLILAYFRTFNEMKNSKHELNQSKIVVLDDSSMTLRIVKKIFTLAQINSVTYYKDPDKFLEDKTAYDVYLIDLVLPKTSGEKLLFKIKETNPSSSVIIMSTVSNYKTISSVLMAGADDYLMKPFDANIFIARLKVQIKYRQALKKLEDQNHQLKTFALTDALTGLYNRRYALEKLEAEILKDQEALAVILLDIDNFKAVNDTYGHSRGDSVLKEVSQALLRVANPEDTVARYGGEEFLVVLVGLSLDQLAQRSKMILEMVSSLHFTEDKLKVTISGGVCVVGHESIDQIIHIADDNLYRAKALGKNRICKDLEVLN